LIAPLVEELIFRFLLINSLTLNGVSLFNAIFWSAVIFGLIHINQVRMKKWWGGSAVNYAIAGGFIFGFVALYYGIIIGIIIHSLSNLINYIGTNNEEFYDKE